ncbi:MAG: hypothetical protein UX92_C0012G0030 [Candidatus Amesbacteria bacterium GW2011_GWA1_47_20]|uniref:Uncharacterized protein n=1 Tax=Candidatus Amesbacteria bacterium GW2011_GWA1_47_20 TaxID=1618354 RepID=A0A0G1SJT9_9BACT|nr:MAG: hypothetical protein UX42_C0008G0007 [Microgenomates group bacterium GW2011_GWC1_46_20]KKU69687.1 MAG: hypothetical protein UX92_C0012G0030 [Candidatus Amesbacteria bacterium GW2011_GWA1_47_20]
MGGFGADPIFVGISAGIHRRVVEAGVFNV